jgi:hypothetical protein
MKYSMQVVMIGTISFYDGGLIFLSRIAKYLWVMAVQQHSMIASSVLSRETYRFTHTGTYSK